MTKTKPSTSKSRSVPLSEPSLINVDSKSETDNTSICNSAPIRIALETKTELIRILSLVAQQGGRRKIKADTVIRYALGKLKDQDFDDLRAKTVSYSELFDSEFQRYKRQDPSITRDQFLGMILLGTVKIRATMATTK